MESWLHAVKDVNAGLTLINLRGSAMQAGGVDVLNQVLNGSLLRTLILDANPIGDDGMIAFAHGLRSVQDTLEFITVDGCDFASVGVAALLSCCDMESVAWKHLNLARISYAPGDGAVIARFLARVPRLETLVVNEPFGREQELKANDCVDIAKSLPQAPPTLTHLDLYLASCCQRAQCYAALADTLPGTALTRLRVHPCYHASDGENGELYLSNMLNRTSLTKLGTMTRRNMFARAQNVHGEGVDIRFSGSNTEDQRLQCDAAWTNGTLL